MTKKYPKEDIVVVWQPHICSHSTKCFNGLPEVFDPRVSPWITTEGASKEELIKQIKKCPSGALSYITSENKTEQMSTESTNAQIKITSTGPYLVTGTIELIDDKGMLVEKKENFALCRCGHSKNKPFCDGQHRQETSWLEIK